MTYSNAVVYNKHKNKRSGKYGGELLKCEQYLSIIKEHLSKLNQEELNSTLAEVTNIVIKEVKEKQLTH